MHSLITKIDTPAAPPASGPYSQATMISGNARLLFVSGQLPINPKDGKLIDGDIRQRTKQIIDNIEAILQAAGSSLENVVRVEIFLTSLSSDFSAMNTEYMQRFNGKVAPARQTVGVAELPMGSTIEMSCIAVAG